MGLRFRKSIGLGKGIRLNLGKGSVGISAGAKGARFSVNSSRGATSSVGVPGTGLSYSNTSGGGGQRRGRKVKLSGKDYLLVLGLWLLLVGVGYLLFWIHDYRDAAAAAAADAAAATAALELEQAKDAIKAFAHQTYGENVKITVGIQGSFINIDVASPWSEGNPPQDVSAAAQDAATVATGVLTVVPDLAQTDVYVHVRDADRNNLIVVDNDGNVKCNVFTGIEPGG